jgi:hypothetical protein
MQFVRHGPDIPERLLQLHEDGRVVFFCGAGISYPARLPGFSGLVEKLYQALSATPSAVQKAAIKAGQFDTAIGLLEAEVVVGRETVRRALAGILSPDLTAPNATATHEALLMLGQNRDGRTRLITTNFDRLFEHVITCKSLPVTSYQAPLLPVPKNRWNGLVYLHGLLSPTPTSGELDRLVISSGDFGLAYLTERWAARFVSELFRGYTVCFVGYSINDPVLRYMMDALAADRLLGESPPEMFAFGSYSKGKEEERANEWKAKNVTPILYREHRRHAYLHKTLHAWAATYRDGVRGKERIVVECAIGRPLASTKQDDFVGRMLWALSDPRGLPAKRFAELDPVPSLDWLEPLSQDIYRHNDLGRFGVSAQAAIDESLVYSMTGRPAPYSLAPWMTMVGGGNLASRWDEVMHHLARWLIRHLDDPNLLLWLVKRGGQLHDQLSWLIERRLEELAKLEHDGNLVEIARIRGSAPNAVPTPAMRTLWRLMLNGCIKPRARDLDLYRWREHFKRDGLTASVRLALREALTPRVSLREPLRWASGVEDGEGEPKRIKDIVEWEIVLTADHVHAGLRDMPKDARWAAALPNLLNDFSTLLRDAMDLMHELGGVNNQSDHTYIDQPSISDHPQNKDYRDWTALIELTRDAWLATAAQLPEQARIAAEAWAYVPYPVFRRLAFFAAAQEGIFDARRALDLLLMDGHWWLWSEETRRETLRLLVAIAPRLDVTLLHELEQAILAGPPHTMYREDIDPEEWAQLVDRNVWLRLAKILQAGAVLSANANAHFSTLAAQYPSRQLAADERDEFPFWMEGGWVGDRDPWRSFTPVPRTRRGVLDYLIAHPVLEASEQDDWRKRCSDSFQATAYALHKLTQQGNWPVERWRDALQAWSEENLLDRSWRHMAPVMARAPDDLLQSLAHGITWWLKSVAKTFQGHEENFLTLIQRILRLDFEPEDDDDLVFRAINHPVGHVTQALLDWWYRQDIEDGQHLPDSIKPVFSKLCDTNIEKYKYGRLLLAAHVITLFRVDRAWAQQCLLPLFDWQLSENEARAAWEGFLWSPRLYRPLMEKLKPAFLETATHYSLLGKHSEQYASLLTFAALDPGDTFTTSELANAVRALPPDGLREVAETLTRALEGTEDQREDYWKNRVLPFWDKIWPKSNDRASDTSATSLARLCIAAGNEFPEAIAVVGKWLRSIEHPDYVIDRLHESGLCIRFPECSLQLLDAILADQLSWVSQELRQCLNAIGLTAPNLCHDRRFMRVDELARRFGV